MRRRAGSWIRELTTWDWIVVAGLVGLALLASLLATHELERIVRLDVPAPAVATGQQAQH